MSFDPQSVIDIFSAAFDDISRRLDHIGNALTRPEPAPLPSRWARVHAMGNNSYLGEVEPLPRGAYRITYYDGEVTAADYPNITADMKIDPNGTYAIQRMKDIRAVHSIDWLTEAEYKLEVARAQKIAMRALGTLIRRHWPKGYEPARRNSYPPHAFRRLSDKRVCGFFGSESDAREQAWADAERPDPNLRDLSSELSSDPVEPGDEGEMNDLDDDFPV